MIPLSTKVRFGVLFLATITTWHWCQSRPNLCASAKPMASTPVPEFRAALGGSPAASHRKRVLWRELVNAELAKAPQGNSDMLERAAEAVPLAEIPEALQRITASSAPVAAELEQLLVRRWAEADPTQAAAWAAARPEDARQQRALEQIAIVWAGQDLTAAVAWVNSLAESAGKTSVVLSLGYEAARTNPLQAIELASAIPATPAADDLLAHSVSQWATQDSQSALDWVQRVTDPQLRQRLLGNVAVALARRDAPHAAALVAGSLVAGDEQSRAAVAVVQRWAEPLSNALRPHSPCSRETRIRRDSRRFLKNLPTRPPQGEAVLSLRAASKRAFVPQIIAKSSPPNPLRVNSAAGTNCHADAVRSPAR